MSTPSRGYDLASLRYAAENGNPTPAENAHREIHCRLSRMIDGAAAASRTLTADEQHVYDEGVAEMNTIAEIRARGVERRNLANLGAAYRPAVDDDNVSDSIRSLVTGRTSRASIGLDLASAVVDGKASGVSRRSLSTASEIRPRSLADEIFLFLVQQSAVLAANPTMFRTAAGEDFVLPRFTAFSSGSAIAEGALMTFTDPTVSNVTLKAHKFMSGGQITTEAMTDASFDMMPYYRRQLAESIGTAISNVLVNGTGTVEPNGIVAAGSVGVTGGTGVSGAPTADNLIDLVYSVNSAYRNVAECAWIMNDATFGYVRKLKDTTNQYLLGTLADGTETLLGYPVYTDNRVASYAVNTRSIYFGNVRRNYAVRMAGEMRIDLSVDYAFANDLITVRALQRIDGQVIDANAARVFRGGTA